MQLAVDAVHRALQRHGDPLVEVDAVGQAPVMVRGGAQAVLGNAAELIALLQALDAVLDRGRGPELLLHDARGLAQLALIPQLGEHHVPGGERHDDQQHQHGAGDEIAALPERDQAVGIVDVGGGAGAAGVWFSIVSSKKKAAPSRARRLITELFRHLELDAEHEARIDRLAVLGSRLDIAARASLGQLHRALIQTRAARGLRDRRRLGELAVRADADVHRRPRPPRPDAWRRADRNPRCSGSLCPILGGDLHAGGFGRRRRCATCWVVVLLMAVVVLRHRHLHDRIGRRDLHRRALEVRRRRRRRRRVLVRPRSRSRSGSAARPPRPRACASPVASAQKMNRCSSDDREQHDAASREELGIVFDVGSHELFESSAGLYPPNLHGLRLAARPATEKPGPQNRRPRLRILADGPTASSGIWTVGT